MLAQALSNLVTSNDTLADTLWTTYLNDAEERLILTYVVSSVAEVSSLLTQL